jgi:anti-sigma factor RsiW
VKRDCDNLDAFLADELAADASTQFAQHLEVCDDCREAVGEQRWIDGLLRSGTHESDESVPQSLYESLRHSTVRRRHSVRLIACGLAAIAAAIAVAAGWTLTPNRQADGIAANNNDAASEQHVIVESNIHAAAAIDAQKPQATFVSSDDTIAVPIESTDDDVTVVQLYPTTQTERRWRRELALQITHSESNGG